jgi:hypothetical protein
VKDILNLLQVNDKLAYSIVKKVATRIGAAVINTTTKWLEKKSTKRLTY